MRLFKHSWSRLFSTMLAIVSAGAAESAYAIAYWTPDYDVINPSGDSGPPVDFDTVKNLLRPAYNSTSGEIGTGGVAIAPKWILTARHNVWDTQTGIKSVARSREIGGVPYNNGSAISDENIFIHPEIDIALMNLEDRSATAPYVPLLSLTTGSLVGRTYSQSGYGFTSELALPGSSPSNIASGTGTLRWGRNVITSSSAVSIASSLDLPSSDGYVLYEGRGNGNDSGNGWFVRDGWDWQLAGITSSGLSAVAMTDELRTWITNIINTEDPGGLPAYSQTARPVPTTFWTNVTSSDWSTGSNWLMQQTPDYSVSNADVALVNVANGPTITSVAKAQDLYVGAANSVTANVIVSAGGSLEVVGLFLGAESTEKGQLTVNGGDVSADEIFIGHYGKGNVGHFSGAVTANRLTIARDTVNANDSTSAYSIFGLGGIGSEATIDVNHLVLGEYAGSNGTLYIVGDSADVHAKNVYVGFGGAGTIDQAGGSTTAESLQIGVNDAIASAYNLSGGTLTVDQLVVGAASTLSHTDGNMNVQERITLRGKLLLKKDGSLLDVSRVLPEVGSEVDFDSSTAGISIANNTDLSDAVFLRAGNARIAIADKRFVVVSQTAADMIDSGGLTFTANQSGSRVTSASSAVHVDGTVFVIDGEEVGGNAIINDPVQLLNAGKLNATGADRIELKKGITASSNSTIKLGAQGTISIPSSVNTSILQAASSIQVLRIDVEAGGHLQTYGTIQEEAIAFDDAAGLSSAGRLSIGSQNGVAEQLRLRSWYDGSRLEPSGTELELGGVSSSLEIELFRDSVGATVADSVQASNVYLAGRGGDQAAAELLIAVDSSDVSGLILGSKATIIETILRTHLDAASTDLEGVIDGRFSSTVYSDATSSDFLAEDRLLAVVYEDQFATGEALANSDIGGCDGACAVIALPGDANLNGYVDNSDAAVMFPYLGTIGGMTWAEGDFNGDGNVDSLDSDILTNYFNTGSGYGGGTASSLASVPEPASLLLVAFGMGAVLVRRRR